jgi:hypothetical protein
MGPGTIDPPSSLDGADDPPDHRHPAAPGDREPSASPGF